MTGKSNLSNEVIAHEADSSAPTTGMQDESGRIIIQGGSSFPLFSFSPRMTHLYSSTNE